MLPAAARTYLGLARRAGHVALGSSATEDALRRRRATVVVLATDAGAASVRRFSGIATAQGVPLYQVGTAAEIGASLGVDPKAVCAVTQADLGQRLIAALDPAHPVAGPPHNPRPRTSGKGVDDGPAAPGSTVR